MTENGTVKKVHSLIDKVYHPTNLNMAWEVSMLYQTFKLVNLLSLIPDLKPRTASVR